MTAHHSILAPNRATALENRNVKAYTDSVDVIRKTERRDRDVQRGQCPAMWGCPYVFYQVTLTIL